MSDLITLRDELIELIGTTWPEVKAHGIYRTREIVRRDFEKKTLPLVVLDMEVGAWDEGPQDALTDEVQYTISYVAGDDTDGDDLVDKLTALRSALWVPGDASPTLTAGQVMEKPSLSDSPDTVVNRYFLMRAWPIYSGMLTVRILNGEP